MAGIVGIQAFDVQGQYLALPGGFALALAGWRRPSAQACAVNTVNTPV
jgi:hypothetical protein